jgi:cell division protein FtsI/penicillin-binding protein 2
MHRQKRHSRLGPFAACLVFLAAALAPYAALAAPPLEKQHLAVLLTNRQAQVAEGDTVQITSPRHGSLTIEPTIDVPLQEAAERSLSQIKSSRAAIVLTEAYTGKVLVLAGVRHGRLDPRVALEGDALAASLFKIVTAAAAVEETQIEPLSRIYFTGRPHTLFKNQFSSLRPKAAQQSTLRESFAVSNNPVFAKLGIFHLGGDLLTWYGKALGFQSRLPFELPLGVSQLADVDDDQSVAGMASGYNRETTISPVHAALLAGLFVNHGRLMEPFIVNRARASSGEILYQGRPRSLGRVVSDNTCTAMRRMFEATITEGTARRAFNQLQKDKVLSRLHLGGKTGTMGSPDHSELFEWFAGYGQDPDNGRTLAISVLVVHNRTRWANSKALARVMLQQAFAPRATHAAQPGRAPAM